ncbi:MAG: ABC transporter permease subunit, partial [Pseudomonadota bacterium]
GLHDTLLGLLLAHTMGALPYMLWTASAAFEAVDRDLERAARDLGAGFWRTFIEVPLPIATPGLIAGAILVFLFSMDEFTITFLISGVSYTTMPVRLYATLQEGFLEPASAAALMMLAPSVVYLFICVRFMRPSDFAGRMR